MKTQASSGGILSSDHDDTEKREAEKIPEELSSETRREHACHRFKHHKKKKWHSEIESATADIGSDFRKPSLTEEPGELSVGIFMEMKSFRYVRKIF